MKSRSAMWCLVLVVGLALNGCGLWERGLESGSALRFTGGSRLFDMIDEPMLTAQLPTGVLQLHWTTDLDLLDTVSVRDDSPARAERGAQFVGLAWKEVPGDGPGGLIDRVVADSALHELVLVSGEQRVVLDPANALLGDGMAVVAVDDASEVSVEVTFDGVAQRVGPGPDDRTIPDEAAALYEEVPEAEEHPDCQAGDVKAPCEAVAAWLPWVAGAGWASPGRLWPVVNVSGQIPGDIERAKVKATLDGAASILDEDLSSPSQHRFSHLLVFPEARPGPTELRLEASGPDITTYVATSVLTPSP